MKSKYWSCSKFADLVRGTPKPFAGTNGEWRAWEKTANTKKLRYWLAEEGLDYLQSFIFSPVNLIKEIRCYIENRWVIKSHALTSNLKRGKWYDFDTRLLHAVFDELVNFVEIELAWKLIICPEEDRRKYKSPWYRKPFQIGRWRCPEAGIAYLNWAAGLKNDENYVKKDDPSYGQSTHQALAAQETLKLYQWWKEERPKRPEPEDASGWHEFCEQKRKAANDDDKWWASIMTNTEEDDRSRDILTVYWKIEKEQEEEDTAMLICLIKLRQNLWT